MCSITDATADAYAKFADHSSEERWILLGYVEGSKNEVEFKESGTGGRVELISKLEDDKCQFGLLKVYGIDDRGTVTGKRTKLVAFTHIGGSVGGMAKGKTGMHKNTVYGVWGGAAACSLDICGEEGVTAEEIKSALLTSGAAHKPTSYDFGGGESLDV